MKEKNQEKIISKSIEEEITQSYIDYSMSVIVSRALPDVRDGLKPVLRRILFSMYGLKLFHNSSFKKSAAVVGEVLGKYHPHGDSSVYEALVRLTQDFSLRYPLVEGQGNFGSIDGDGAAAMRYTEARLTKLAEEMLQDIQMQTVDWRDNYDNSKQEPVVLPTKFPNHLCNGTMGIAVGMATNMAPHNLTEVIDACLLLLENKEATFDEIMNIIKGPDFPTGGIIYDSENIKNVYQKGKGGIPVRGKVSTEEDNGKEKIVISQLPYQVNKSTLVSKIGELVSTKKIEGVDDITDESNKSNIRIVITLKKGTDKDSVLTLLYKYTDLQTNFNINNVALIDKGIQPQLLNIKDLLLHFIDFRREVIYNRSVFQLNKAEDRLHILLGLEKAIDILDDVIETIRGSQTRQEAKDALIKNFEFSEPQAEYILMLRLQTLVGLEIQKIIDEKKEKEELIEYLREVINNPEKLDEVVIDELIYIKDEYGDDRRTEVSESLEVYQLDDSVKNLKRLEELQKEKVILWMGDDFETKILYQTRLNIIPENTFEIKHIHNQYKIFAISKTGELVIKRIKDFGGHNIKGNGIDFKKDFNLNEDIVFSDIIDEDFDYLVLLTDKNNIKKVSKELIDKLKKTPTKIMGLGNGESIIKIQKIKENDNVGILSQEGMILMFQESNIRPSGKTAGGVKAIDLDEGEKVANMFTNRGEPFIFIHTNKGGKLISMEDMKIQKRGQAGLVATKLDSNEKLLGGISIDEGAVMMKLSNGKMVEIHSNDIPLKDRNTKPGKITEKEILSAFKPWRE
ncbi:DNA gyrase/topoisomerase IV subunit A [Candidatus Absconditicoccus praedator]|uniref:DNA gyrase/topoisomerase IV subunit A n=1 Tax=Candidatus Absconditicoccus praedator TaxID=2735562 RepID=UPI001E5945B3|nr:DNA topoisomerase (ATP-hydrolyzing) [Candidatus Absconditicoccus praedator]UFX82592.1 DNA topoisomerase 4 subunit A [Candidatus Absconditicoccus praedator]